MKKLELSYEKSKTCNTLYNLYTLQKRTVLPSNIHQISLNAWYPTWSHLSTLLILKTPESKFYPKYFMITPSAY